MVLSNFITHLIRISGRPVVTAGVYSRVTLATSTHRSHLSSIPLLLHHRFLAPLFFAHVRIPDNRIVSTLSQTFRDVFIVELYSSFFPLRFRSKTITHRLFQKQTRNIYFVRDDTPSLGFEILSIEHRPTIFSRYHQGIQGYGEHDFFHCPERSR